MTTLPVAWVVSLAPRESQPCIGWVAAGITAAGLERLPRALRAAPAACDPAVAGPACVPAAAHAAADRAANTATVRFEPAGTGPSQAAQRELLAALQAAHAGARAALVPVAAQPEAAAASAPSSSNLAAQPSAAAAAGGNGGVIELLPSSVRMQVRVWQGAGKPPGAPRHDRVQRVGALLVRVQGSLTASERAWLEWLQRKEPCHSQARRWAATLLLPRDQLDTLVDLCAESLHSQAAAVDTLAAYWRCAALHPSLLRRRSPAQLRYAMATPPSQLIVEAVGGRRVPVTPEDDTMPAHLSTCGAQALQLTEAALRALAQRTPDGDAGTAASDTAAAASAGAGAAAAPAPAAVVRPLLADVSAGMALDWEPEASAAQQLASAEQQCGPLIYGRAAVVTPHRLQTVLVACVDMMSDGYGISVDDGERVACPLRDPDFRALR